MYHKIWIFEVGDVKVLCSNPQKAHPEYSMFFSYNALTSVNRSDCR